MATRVLPKTYARCMPSLRPQLMPVLRSAVDSGDAVTAKKLYRVMAGPEAASQIPPREVLYTVGCWLNAQGDITNDHIVA